MRVTFGVLTQTERLHVHDKFHTNVFIVSDSGSDVNKDLTAKAKDRTFEGLNRELDI